MNIEVGEYIRTKYDGIHKVSIDYKNRVADENGNIHFLDEIVQHSKKIIDLIEVGDIVNNYIVLDVMEDLQTGEIHLEMPSSYPKEGSCAIYNDEIKTILTKEQMEANQYVVK